MKIRHCVETPRNPVDLYESRAAVEIVRFEARSGQSIARLLPKFLRLFQRSCQIMSHARESMKFVTMRFTISALSNCRFRGMHALQISSANEHAAMTCKCQDWYNLHAEYIISISCTKTTSGFSIRNK